MGLNIFSSSGLSKHLDESFQTTPNPIPSKFKILEIEQVNKFVIAKISYYGCSNFEGIKLIVFENSTIKEIESLDIIDPHFFESNKIIARFRPTEEGKKLSLKMCYK